MRAADLRRGGHLAGIVAVAILASCARGGPEPQPVSPPQLPPPSMDRERPERPPPPPAADVSVDTVGAAPTGELPEAVARRSHPPLPMDGTRPPVRGLWVVRSSLLHPDSARAVVVRAERAGFNALLVQVRGRGDAWYRSTREPRAEGLSAADPAYDPLAVIIEEARGRGLQVHAWVNAHLVSGTASLPSDPRHLLRSSPELLSVPRELAPQLLRMHPRDPAYMQALVDHAARNMDRVEGIYTSPLHPEVRTHLAAVVAELVAGYDLDGIHLDYLRFPSGDFDYGRQGLEAFRRALRSGEVWRDQGDGTVERAPAEALLRSAEDRWRAGDPFAYTDPFRDEWNAFRRKAVTASLEAVVARIWALEPELVVTAAVFPDLRDAYEHRFQPWAEWVRSGYLDAVAPMAYTADDAAYETTLSEAVGAVGPGRVWAGVGAYTNSLDGAIRKAQMAVGSGAVGLVLFSYDWAVGPDGGAVAAGDYLGRFARESFMPRTGSPPSGR